MMANSYENIYTFSRCRAIVILPVGNESSAINRKIPKPRSGHRCVADESNLYCFGGYNPMVHREDEEMADDPNWIDSHPLFRELWKFNFATSCWIKLKTTGFAPKELASHCALIYGNHLLVYGGTGMPFGQSSSNKLYSCNLQTLVWTQVETIGEKPVEQYGQGLTINRSVLYVVGGTTGNQYSIDVHSLDLHSCNWEKNAPKRGSYPPRERYRHEIVFHDGKIFVFGGGTAYESYAFRKLPYYDLANSVWCRQLTHPNPECRPEPFKLYPASRRCHSLVHYGDNVYICGGFDGQHIFKDIWNLNLNTFVWRRTVKNVPIPTYFHSAALTSSGCMYVYGGVTHIDPNHRTSTIWKMWLEIPQLKEMCWEAIHFYCPKLHFDHTRLALLKAGIPRNLLDRVENLAEYG